MIPDISYLILNFNPDGDHYAQEILCITIDAFYRRKSNKLTCDIFLLDQGTTPSHKKWLIEKQNQYGFSTILLNRNIGISGAINFFVRTCKAPVIGLITSDVVITSGMDEDLYAKVQISEVFQATPFTDKSDVDYQTWQPKETFGADHVDLSDLQKNGQYFLRKLFGKKTENYLRCVGAELNVMFWRRSVFDKIGYFDERWKACYENIDFSLRCLLAGGCTAISRDSFVWHYHKVTYKNQARKRLYEVDNWPQKIQEEWNNKWPGLSSYINIYNPLKNRTVDNFKEFYNKFEHNIYLPFEQFYSL